MTSLSQDTQAFILAHAWRTPLVELAAVLNTTVKEVETVRKNCVEHAEPKRFAELFLLWHGRAPEEAEWPAPRRWQNGYEWQTRELLLLASLVGTMTKKRIAEVLSARLRQITGDDNAERNETAVQLALQRTGLQAGDLLGGITTPEASKEVGLSVIHSAIANGQLSTRRIGHRHVIPYDEWNRWKASRSEVLPPEGYVQLSSIREALGIRSDKLSEFARMGHIDTAVRCFPFGRNNVKSTKFGTWYVDKAVADKLVEDRHAGRPMPWHGKPLEDNLKVTFRLWEKRRHPDTCLTCGQIWGDKGAPASFAEYVERYPVLEHGQKRHLTRPWSPGMSPEEVASHVGCDVKRVKIAIRTGALEATKQGRRHFISRTNATLWKARRLPTGEGDRSWLSWNMATRLYSFTTEEIEEFVKKGKLQTKVITNGEARGESFLLKKQCATLREQLGYSEEEAASRAGVDVEALRRLLNGVTWRQVNNGRIPLQTVQAIIKRKKSASGHTLEEAAGLLSVSLEWVEERIKDGTVRVLSVSWDPDRLYLSTPMMKRLQKFLDMGGSKSEVIGKHKIGPNMLLLTEAAEEAGVTPSTLLKWREKYGLTSKQSTVGMIYSREDVRSCARRFWLTRRKSTRIQPPLWHQQENSQ